MALNTLKCNHLRPLGLKGLIESLLLVEVRYLGVYCIITLGAVQVNRC